MDLRALRDSRNFALGCFFSFVVGIGIFTTIYLTPLFLGDGAGGSAPCRSASSVFSTGIFQVMRDSHLYAIAAPNASTCAG